MEIHCCFFRQIMTCVHRVNIIQSSFITLKIPCAFFFFFLVFRAAPEAYGYGGSQARGRNGATAAGLCHSNTRSEPRLWPHHSSQQCWFPNPLIKARDWTGNLMVPSQIHFHCATKGIPHVSSYIPLCSQPSMTSDLFVSVVFVFQSVI